MNFFLRSSIPGTTPEDYATEKKVQENGNGKQILLGGGQDLDSRVTTSTWGVWGNISIAVISST
ncbi:MAG: hypothetical protein KDD55_07355, partial [Bdellovibrionales bacterium]|nr:hypothetical protein [Bdellovibrionales bacterium]